MNLACDFGRAPSPDFPLIRNEKAAASQYFQLVDRPLRVVRWIGFQTVGRLEQS